MDALELCKTYQQLLSNKDLEGIQGLFTPDAIVKAPISGTGSVERFHSYLFGSIKKTIAKFPNVITRRGKPDTITMQFSYTFMMAGDHLVVLDGIINFEIDEESGKFRKLTVIYDPTELRRLMDEADVPPPDTPSL